MVLVPAVQNEQIIPEVWINVWSRRERKGFKQGYRLCEVKEEIRESAASFIRAKSTKSPPVKAPPSRPGPRIVEVIEVSDGEDAEMRDAGARADSRGPRRAEAPTVDEATATEFRRRKPGTKNECLDFLRLPQGQKVMEEQLGISAFRFWLSLPDGDDADSFKYLSFGRWPKKRYKAVSRLAGRKR